MSDWWSRKLAGGPASAQSTPPTSPRPVVLSAPQPTYQSQPPAPSKARHLTGAHTCPDCGSGNYMEQAGGRARCFDCGYPLVQSTSGMIADPGTPTQAAQQISTTYSPTIEGRIE